MKKFVFATLASGVVINLSEFPRNELLLKDQWLDHFEALGVQFPGSSLNGMLWALWGLVFAGCLVAISSRFRFLGAIVLSWLMGFFLMWLVAANLGVLPLDLLWVAVPWSMAEVALALVVARKILGLPYDNG